MAPTLKILGVYLQVFVLWGLAGMEQLSADKSKDRPPKNWRSGLTGLCQTDDILALISRLDSCMQ